MGNTFVSILQLGSKEVFFIEMPNVPKATCDGSIDVAPSQKKSCEHAPMN
jgi:hypothetical protein